MGSPRSDVIFLERSVGPAPAAVLVAAPLHPFPPGSGSAVRIAQYVRHLAARGVAVDLAVLSDSRSPLRDEECARQALSVARRVLVVRHPLVTSGLQRLIYRIWGRLRSFRLGDWLHAPPRYLRAVQRRLGAERYRAVIVSGAHLARVAGLFRPPTLRVLEAQDVWFDRYQSYAALGRGAELGNFGDPGREARLVSRFDHVLAITARDADLFRSLGVERPISVMPFAADPDLLGLEACASAGEAAHGSPARPPRLLFVGTETSSNLDAIRFFRARVFPSIRRHVPSCRLRVVGKAALHLDPDPAVDLTGWVEDLGAEYRDAAAVVVPLRMGSGLKSKVVEALAHGKALLTTTLGVQGLDLVAGKDAVVSDDPAVLAREAVRILISDEVRQGFEENARDLARRLFDPEQVFRPLRALLGLEEARRRQSTVDRRQLTVSTSPCPGDGAGAGT